MTKYERVNLISVDLAMHQTGLAFFDGKSLINTNTMKDTIKGKYQELNIEQLEGLKDTLLSFISPYKEQATILLEWTPEDINKRLERYQISVISYLAGLGYKVIPINANRWLRILDDLVPIKRDSYKAGREGNKEWLVALTKHIFKTYQFQSQDEIDATMMGLTYEYRKERF